jgi:hypothetical protein
MFEQKSARPVNHHNPGLFSGERLRNVVVGGTKLVEGGRLVTPRDGYGIEHLYLIVGVAPARFFRLPSCHDVRV